VVVRKGDPCPVVEKDNVCGKPVLGASMCSMHYSRQRRYGDPLYETRRYEAQGAECAHGGCDAKPKRRGFCEKHASRDERHGTTEEPRVRRFWAQVNKHGPVPAYAPELGSCWLWTGYIHPKTGYGQFGVQAKARLAHRVAYQYAVGPIPKGRHLDHLCKVVRPDHLEPVTPRENIRRGDQGAFWGYQPEPVPERPKAEKLTVCIDCGTTEKPVYKSGRCRPCYRKWLKDPNVERPSRRTPEQRFWAKVSKTDTCWVWTAGINRKTGYARFAIRHGEMMDGHRYSYELHHGPIPEGYDVHHTCHVRHCVNPAHLEAVTRSENLRLRKLRR